MLLYTTQRSGRAGRRRHGCERRRELRVEVRRRGGRRDQRAERVGVRGVVGRHARTPPAVLFAARRTRRRRASFWAGAATAGASAARGRRAAATAATRRAGGRLPTAFPSTKVSGHWSKLRAVRLRLSFNDYASQALFRRVAETTNLAPFVKQALTHDEAIHRKPDLPRGK